MLEELGQTGLEEHRDQALNERDYGDLSGLNKDDARKKWGEEQVHIWRRSYDVNPPGGESLRDTGARVWPYYLTRILPDVMRGRRVLVSAHGNSLRSLVMVLDRLAPGPGDEARARHRRAARLPPERRYDGGGEGSAGRLTTPSVVILGRRSETQPLSPGPPEFLALGQARGDSSRRRMIGATPPSSGRGRNPERLLLVLVRHPKSSRDGR